MRSCWNLKFVSLFLCYTLGHIVSAIAQFSLPQEILTPRTTSLPLYLFPVNPGSPNLLAGTMGELRSTHFHTGIDIRTNNMIGVPILATQSGYISRVIVGAYGYGNALMITHPDGNVSLYGHLDKFKGAIADYILKEQYARKSFDIDLPFKLGQFEINRGDTIALSGNTGGSTGPHLHFEIRNQNNEALNPLSFGFSEIKDVLSPIAFKVALTTLDINSRINDRFGRYEFSVIRSGNNYSLPFPIFANGKIGVEILAHDKLDRSQFRCGINYIEMFADSTKLFTQEIEKISFNESYDIVTLMDFKILKTKGSRFNRLYVADGNPLTFYKSVLSKGEVQVLDTQRKIKINLRDLAGNKSQIKFTLKHDAPTESVSFLEQMTNPIDYDITENTLVVNSKVCSNKKYDGEIFIKGVSTKISPAYSGLTKNVYLIDLRKTLPDSLKTCSGNLHFNFSDVVPSGTDYHYYSDFLDADFSNGNLYDTLYLNANYKIENNREQFTLGNLLTPLHQTINITLKPKTEFKSLDKTSAYHIEGKKFEYLGGEWLNNKITFKTHELGDFVLLADTIPPNIGRIYCNQRSARFRISDGLSGIASFEANINGEWLLMKYDYKTGIIQSEKLDKKQLLKGDFELKVRDRAGNERVYKQKIVQQK